MVPAELTASLGRLHGSLESMSHQIKTIVSNYCELKKFAWVSRSKDEDAIVQKIETGRFQNFSDMDDLIAYSIIVPTLAYEEEVRKFLGGQFQVVSVKGRLEIQRDPRSFDFDSTRVYCRLRKPEWDDGRLPWVYKLQFEVQIRSALEHAWATIIHDLTYKGGDIDWRSIRLASSIKAQLEIIDVMLRDFDSVKEKIEPRPWRDDANRKAMIGFIGRLASEDKIPRIQLPADIIRLSDNILNVLTKNARRELTGTLDKLEGAIDHLNSEGFPRSLTMFQVIVVSLLRSEPALIDGNKTFHVTSAMRSLHPEAAKLPQQFSYDVE